MKSCMLVRYYVMDSPAARSKRHMEAAGYRVATVERWNHVTRTRHDAFGFLDLIAIRPSQIVGVQTTTGGHVPNRIGKITGERAEEARDWLAAGGLIEVHGWRQLKVKRGGKAKRWHPIVVSLDWDGKQFVEVRA